MQNVDIGIIGLGYVGQAVESFLKKFYKIHTYDINGKSNCNSLKEVVDLSEVLFICLPTPSMKDGSCDLRIVEDVISNINILSKKSSKLIVIKSTIPVGTTDKFIAKYKKIKFCFNPEFLTEANFIEDFENQERIIIGGDNIDLIYNIYLETFKDVKIITTDCKTAEMVKYVTNTFLATKVSFANEISSFCSKLNIDYERIIDIAKLDHRLGSSHWKVPGPDGKKGYGGSCFPKDIASLINQFENNKIESIILKSSFNRNNNIDRPDKDWQKLKGRSVSDE
jgi:UDPglucose 6-dehydrogenase